MSLFWTQYPLGTHLTWDFAFNQAVTEAAGCSEQLAIIGNYITATASGLTRFPRDFFSELTSIYRASSADQPPAFRLVFSIACVVFSIVFAILYLSLVVLTVAFGALIAPVVVTVLAVWLLGLLLSFLAWFMLYRLPVYDVMYPRIRSWTLRQNAAVYRALPLSNPTSSGARTNDMPFIRLVSVKAGCVRQKIECELMSYNLGAAAAADFEALSYVWGINIFPYTIKMNGEDFYVTRNLFEALRELRRPDRNRLLWVDGLCINQYDNWEKTDQVCLMRAIYSRASLVTVWLGPGSRITAAAFDLVRQLGNAATIDGDRDRLWTAATSAKDWWSTKKVFRRVLSHAWWTRVWIIQEAVVAQRVVVQEGSHQVEWDKLLTLFEYSPFQELFQAKTPSILFAINVQDLRKSLLVNNNVDANAEPNTLLDLVYQFRHQSATLGSDRIYAVLGLLQPDQVSSVSPDYSKSSEEVFLDFTIACLEETKSLSIVALASGTAIQGTSWCRDWRIPNDGFGLSPFEFFSGYDIYNPSKDYSATGTSVPQVVVVDLNPKRRVLKVKGFELDIVSRRGACQYNSGNRPMRRWSYTLHEWEHIAGGPWSPSSHDVSLSEAFNRSIVADRWPRGPEEGENVVDWRTEVNALDSNTIPRDDSYAMALSCAAINRRFFVTRSGGFGLGPMNLQSGDVMVAILGSSVPLVLRRVNHIKSGREQKTGAGAPARGIQAEEFWKVIGEAYLDGAMYYGGDIDADIRDGRVAIEDYSLI
ncbi:heterokaryon incompatibility protein-domain-containing protein [Xylariaceae sp. AK1471]|nr:heterokaryon incompatibility protein-domain-containing protein [Xylariaceae sp. AK1471]